MNLRIIFKMKQKKFLKKNFRKKYVFLQNSLFDFLSWRSQEFSQKNEMFQIETKIKKDLFLEQDKISFQEYWKKADSKKMKNFLKNMNNEFYMYELLSSSSHLKKKQRSDLQNFPLKNTEIKNKKKEVFFLPQKNNKKISKRSQGGTLKMNFSFVGKKQTPFSRLNSFNSNSQILLPISDFFWKKNKFDIFENGTIGEFFPKRKNFQQYWIFPLLGFVLLFSSNSKVFFAEQSESTCQLSNTSLFLEPFTKNVEEKSLKNIFQNQFNRSGVELENLENFSYSDQLMKEYYSNFKKLENMEFENLCAFYFQIFKKSFFSFVLKENDSKLMKNELLKISKENFFSKAMETKRNVFHWKWFSTQLTKPSSFSHPIPQKSQFYFDENSLIQKCFSFSEQTPLLDFSKSAFLLNEFEKTLLGNSQFFEKVKKQNFSTLSFVFNDQQEFKIFNADIENLKVQKYFELLEKEINKSSLDFQKNEKISAHKRMNSFFIDLSQENFSTNSILFQKWLQTQKFWVLKKAKSIPSGQEDKKTQIFEKTTKTNFHLSYLHDFILKKNMKTFQKFENLKEKNSKSHLNLEVFENSVFSLKKKLKISQTFKQLDAIFLKKIFQKVQSFENLRKKNKLKTFNNVSNYSGVMDSSFFKKNEKYNIKFQNGRRTENKNFLSLKKELSEVLLFDYYKTKYLNFVEKKLEFEKNFSTKNEKIKNRITEKEIFNSAFLTRLEHPIFFDFGFSYLPSNFQIHSLNGVSKSKEQEKNFSFRSIFSNLSNPNIFSHNLEYQPTLVSSNYYNLITNFPKIYFFQTFSSFEKKSESESKKLNFVFFVSKKSFFEKMCQKLKNNFSLYISSFESFQKAFFVEKTRKRNAFMFRNHDDLHNLSLNFSIFSEKFSAKQKNQYFLKQKNSKFSILLRKYSQRLNIREKMERVSSSNQRFSNMKFRKFEKIFLNFLSPLNNENIQQFIIPKFVNSQKENKIRKKLQKKSFLKNQKDKILLENLSESFQRFSNYSKYSYFISVEKLESQEQFNSWNFSDMRKKIQVQKKQKFAGFNIKKHEISPEFILKRDGFVVFSFSENSQKKVSFFSKKRKIFNIENSKYFSNISFFPERKNEKEKSLFFQRFQKEKSFQKKRRMKKQKLETRRRKKRKRFYPRPVWLRFHLYKKFLNVRHPKKEVRNHFFPFIEHHKIREENFRQTKRNFEKIIENKKTSKKILVLSPKIEFPNQKNSLPFPVLFANKNRNDIGSFFKENFDDVSSIFSSTNFLNNIQKNSYLSKKYRKNKTSFVFHFQKENSLKDLIFQKNNQKWGFSWENQLQKKIFLKKSISPFQSSQRNFVSQNIEHYKISGEILSEFLRLSWKSYWFQTNFQPYTQRITRNFQKMKKIESQNNLLEYNFQKFFGHFQFPFLFRDFSVSSDFENDFLFKKVILKKFSWYSNIQTSLNSQVFENVSFNFQKMQNLPEYNRILYLRISEILKDFKFAENNDEFLSRLEKNRKIPRRKNENIFSNSSFLTKVALFGEHFQIPSQPSIPAFSLFSSIFHDSSLKPSGQLPTLRALWAFQKTNISCFQESNIIREMWTLKKRTDSFKTLKGTKTFFNFLRKYGGIEKFSFPLSKKEDFPILNATNQNLKKQNSEISDQEKFSFLATRKSDFSEYFNQLDAISILKFQNVEKKSSLFGINSLKENSKLSLRYFKFHLLQKQFQHNFTEKNNGEKMFGNNFLKQQNNGEFPTFIKKSNPFNSAKSSLNFWWAQQNYESLQFLFSKYLENTNFFSLNKKDFFLGDCEDLNSFFLNSSFLNSSNQHLTQQKKNTLKNFDFEKNDSNHFFLPMQVQIFWFGAIVFHLAIFSTVLKIPEIRSVLKFQCLIFYKAINSFSSILFSIYFFIKKYTEKVFSLVQFCLTLLKKRKRTNFESFEFISHQFLGQENQQQFSTQKILSFLNSFYFQNEKSNMVFGNFISFQNNILLKSSYSVTQNKNYLFDFFVRFSPFSKNFFSFSSKGKNSTNFLVAPKTKNEENSKNSTSSFNEINEMNFFSKQIFLQNHDFAQKFEIQYQKQDFFQILFQKNISVYQKMSAKMSGSIFSDSDFSSFQTKMGVPAAFQVRFDSKSFNIQTFPIKKGEQVSQSEKILSELALSYLLFVKSITIFNLNIGKMTSSISGSFFNFLEFFMFSIYKFLEKPAELIIEWIALIFLIEWSSDTITFIPDTFDIFLTKNSRKFIRPFQTGSFILDFFYFSQLSKLSFLSSQISLTLPANMLYSTQYLTSSNMAAFLLKKRLFYFFENFWFEFNQPDMDILTRQRKGMIFWDIWAEILLKAAEKYNVNIPSFVTLKEEQELFIEKLLQDPQFFQIIQIEKNKKQKVLTQDSNLEALSNNNLGSFVQNFLIKERPQNLPVFSSSKNVKQFDISHFVSSTSFQNWFFSRAAKKIYSESDLLESKENEKNQKRMFDKKKNAFFKNSVFNFGKHNVFSSRLSASHILFKNSSFGQLDLSDSFNMLTSSDRWSCNQYGTYQGQETDLFVDIHPSKSFQHIHFFKYNEPSHSTLGSIVCQVYSGLFSKQVSKNILLIGSPGTAKTLFIQALAGETEMKIITDNAYRYATVQRGVAVGMKYLRDVFDAIALQTPCFFLMEHIHIIGSKRPLLISDDENIKGIQASFGLEQQEVHETNQMIYQLTRHSISDYKKPYKGDFSMSIPTNFFVQNFYSKFEKTSFSLFQNSQFSAGGAFSSFRQAPTSPLPVDSIEDSLSQKGSSNNQENKNFGNTNCKKSFSYYRSRLQITNKLVFAPPATSPFTVLMMKEQKKLKPKKIVQETSWGGLSTDQLLSYQKESYSVRAKVAALADITMNLSRGKLDMITDLLVIIDSVRSNRGFVVFATTHLPSSLDPALRRPGRFDETILLSQNPNFLNRFEIFQTNFEKSLSTLDFLDSSLVTENFSETDIFKLITSTKLSFFHQYTLSKIGFSPFQDISSPSKKKQEIQSRIFSQISPFKALQSFFKSSFFHDFYSQKSLFSSSLTKETQLQLMETSSIEKIRQSNDFVKKSSIFFEKRNSNLFKFSFLPNGPSHVLSLAYSKVGTFLIQSLVAKDPTSFTPLTLDIQKTLTQKEFLGYSLYKSQKEQKIQLMIFLSGRIAEFCMQKNFSLNTQSNFMVSSPQAETQNLLKKKRFSGNVNSSFNILKKPSLLFEKKFAIFSSISKKEFNTQNLDNQIYISQSLPSTKYQQTPNFVKNDYFWTAFGNNETWHSTTPFISSIIQKRFLFTKNLLLSKMLFFDNRNQRKQPPNPPSSSIFMPSKKYENFKRVENDFVRKAQLSIHEKIQMHQQQRFFKQLYNIPLQQYFRSEMISKRSTLFSSSFQELAYLDSLTTKSSSVSLYQKKYLSTRHRFSSINQWWNGMLPEHNTETTYLSDVDWRTMFVFSPEGSQQKTSKSQDFPSKNVKFDEKSTHDTFEFTMDFPDAEQYYNPRNRRWYFNSRLSKNDEKNFSFWLSFDTNLQHEIYYHYFMQSFQESFHYFDKNREMLDFFVFSLLEKGFLKELDYLTTLSRFHKFQKKNYSQ